MKRHESIAALSREHHFGLLFCWKIRQGIKKMTLPERMRPYVQYFLDNHLKPHFEEEENLLFSVLPNDDLVEQAKAEHLHILSLAFAISDKEHLTTTDQFNILADAIDNHIRFEERILFPHFEKELTDDALATLGKQLQQLHQETKKDDYPDEFWL